MMRTFARGDFVLLIDICGLKINYEEYGKGKEVILLHGWGANIDSFAPVSRFLSNNFRVIAIDLPGFGKSEMTDKALNIADYANFVSEFIKKMSIQKPILIGHSNGGRIIIYLTAKKLVAAHKIILIDSAGIKPKRKLKYYLKVYLFKTIKKFLQLPIFGKRSDELIERARSKFGSTDYKNASGVLRQTMVKLVNEDLRGLLPEIKASTLLIWGENDTATPVSDGKLMEKLIPDAGLVVLKNAGHFSYLDKQNEFNTIISSFLKEDMGE